MKRLLAFIAVLTFSATAAHAAEKYEFDKEHTDLLFSVNHLGYSDTVGRFTEYDGHFMLDMENPENSSVDVTIRPTGIVTASKGLDEHLQKEEFFNTEKFPEVKFVSTKVVPEGQTAKVTGDLTLLGVTKPVTLDVTLNKADYHPMNNKFVAGFTASGAFNRSEFGMDTYVPMVGDEVKLEFQIEGVNLDREPGKPEHQG